MNDLKRAVVQIPFEGKKYNILITEEVQKQILLGNCNSKFVFLFELNKIFIFSDKVFAKTFFEQAREKIQKKFAPPSENGPMTSQVAQPYM
jgi:hypothetical protein